MLRTTAKILLYAAVALIVFIAGSAVFTQTGAFKSALRASLYKIVESELDASVYIGEIHGNIVTGFQIDSVALYVNNAPFVESGSISIRYDPLPLWNKTVNIVSLELEHPEVTLIRFADSTWNVNRLSKKKPESDSLPSPWQVIAKHLVVRDAHFRMIDSVELAARSAEDAVPGYTLDYANLDLRALDIDLSGRYSEREQSLKIHNISFQSPREGFRLERFSAQIEHTPVLASVQSLLLQTPASHIELSAQASGIDVFRIGGMRELEHIPVEARIVSSTVSSRDLQVFLPVLDFLEGAVYLDASAKGTFAALDVPKLDCSFNKSILHIKGGLANLHRPHDLFIHAESQKSVINPSDVVELMPYFGIPDYSDAGESVLDCTFHGYPLNFAAKGTLETKEAGTISIDGTMDLTGRVMQYKASAEGRGVNLAVVTGEPELRSRLNFTSKIEGQGASISELRSKLDVTADSSLVRDIPFSHFTGSFTAAERVLKGDWTIASPKGMMTAQGKLDWTHPGDPSYKVTGMARAVDLSAVMKDPYYQSAISFAFKAEADRFSFLDANAHIGLEFTHSAFGAYMFDSTSVTIETRQFDDGKSLEVSSPVGDIFLKGRFTLTGVAAAVKAHALGIEKAYNEQRRLFGYAYGDSSQASAVEIRPSKRGREKETNEPFYIEYSAVIKDLKPLAVFFQTTPMSVQGTLDGSITGDADTLSADGKITIAKGTYAQADSAIAARDLILKYTLTHMKRDSLFTQQSPMKIDIRFFAKDFRIGSTFLHSPSVQLALQGSHGELAVSGDIDTMMSVSTSGIVDLIQPSHHIMLDNFAMRYHGFDIRNLQPVRLTIAETGIRIDSSFFAHGESQLLAYGSIDFKSRLTGAAFLTNFPFADIRHFGSSPRFRANAELFGGAWDANVLVGGTLREPKISSAFRGYNIAYRETQFGTVKAKIEYDSRRADVSCRIMHETVSGSKHDLELEGVIPIDLAFVSTDNRTDLDGMDVTLSTDNIQMSLFDPFIPEITNVRGILNSSIHVTGSIKNPRFHGDAALSTGSFRLINNGMTYQAEGVLAFDSTRVTLNAFHLKNIPTDYDAGGADVDGYVLMKGFAPDEYHLHGTGELMVMQERIRTENRSFFGNLVGATGPDGLRFEGTYDQSLLSGLILVRQANLTFPPEAQQYEATSRISRVITIDDTTKISADSLMALEFANEVSSSLAKAPGFESTFMDGLSYELDIQTQGNVRVQMIFNANPAAYEELYAELNGRLMLIKEGKNVRLTGTIKVGDQSTYTWYKKFSASGSLIFTGPPENPMLDITAKYEGTHKAINEQKESKVVITMKITGVRLRPDPIKWSITEIDETGKETEKTDDVQNNAVSFLLTSSAGVPGKYRDDLNNQDRNEIASQVGDVFLGSVSGLLSSAIMDFVQRNRIPFVKKVEVLGSTGLLGNSKYSEGAELRLSGEMLDAYFSIGGSTTYLNSANVSIQYPLGDKTRRNFMLELERRVENIDYYSNPYLSARLYYRFIF
ncbi:MAG: translocation/assembly module TamB domain-containing protein [Acidobacteriota bacterium]